MESEGGRINDALMPIFQKFRDYDPLPQLPVTPDNEVRAAKLAELDKAFKDRLL